MVVEVAEEVVEEVEEVEVGEQEMEEEWRCQQVVALA